MSEQEIKPTEAENQAPETNDQEGIEFEDGVETETLQTTEENKPPEETKIEEGQEDQKKPINQEAVDKRINEITFEKHEERRKREQAEKELAELRASIEKQQAAEEKIEIPDLPDVYADDYEEKVKAREEALQKAAEIRAKKELLKEQQQKEEMSRIEKQNAEIMKQVDTMYTSANDFGISKEELEAADKKVSSVIQDMNLARYILKQKDSALIVKHLSSSAEELEALGKMNPMDASVYIATKVIPEAQKLKPGITKAPDPIDIPKGRPKTGKDPFLEGVQFE